MTNCFVVELSTEQRHLLRSRLEEQGFTFSQPTHTLFQAKKEHLVCTLYGSGKLTVQGKGMKEFIEYFLEPEILNSFTYGYEEVKHDLSARIGVDESGKGDFFGPLCIAGVFADEKTIPELAKMGVRDSKKVQDASCLKIAGKIRALTPHSIVRINPLKYNELYEKFGNLNLLLGWGHATVIENLVEQTGCEKIIIDQFAAERVVIDALKRKKRSVSLTQRTKAEQDIVVAAASILARAAFLEGLEKLSQQIGLTLPKGASSQTISVGKQLVEKYDASILNTVGKVHFKTYTAILDFKQ